MAFATPEVPVSHYVLGNYHHLETPAAHSSSPLWPDDSEGAEGAEWDKKDENSNSLTDKETHRKVELGVVYAEGASKHADIVTAYFNRNGKRSALCPCDEIGQFKASLESLLPSAVLYILVDEDLRKMLHTQYAVYTQLFEDIVQSGKVIYVVSCLEDAEDFQEVKYKLPRKIRENVVPREKFYNIPNGIVSVRENDNLVVQIGDNNQLKVDAGDNITGTQVGGNSMFHYRSDTSVTGIVLTVKTPEADHQLDVSIKKHIDDKKEHINIVLKDLHAKVISTELGSVIIQVEVEEGTKIGSDWLKKLITAILSEDIISRLPQDTRMEINIKAFLSLKPFDVNIFDTSTFVKEVVELAKSSKIDPATGKTFMHHIAAAGTKSVIHELMSPDLIKKDPRDIKKNTLLHEATRSGNDEAVDLLIQGGADIHAENVDHHTPLHIGIIEDRPKCIERLLNAENPNITFLAQKESENRDRNLKANSVWSLGVELIQAEVKIEAKDENGNTALHIAAEAGNLSMVDVLTAHGASLTETNNNKETPMHRAAATGKLNCLLKLSSSKVVKMTDHEGNTPLHVINRNKPVKPAHIPFENRVNGSPLHIAVKYRNVNAASLLIQYGQDVNATDSHKQTPLHIVSGLTGDMTNPPEDEENILSELLMDDVDMNAQNIWGNSAIQTAISLPDIPLALILLKFSADVTNVNKAGDTALHTLATLRNISRNDAATFLQFFKRKGGNINARNEKGSTALYVAVESKNENLAITLLEEGADVHLKNKSKKSSADIIRAWRDVFPELYAALMSRSVSNVAEQEDRKEERAVFAVEQKSNKPKEKTQEQAEQFIKIFNATCRNDDYAFQTIMHAAYKGDLKRIIDCVNNGELIHQRNIAGDTPLHILARTYGQGSGHVHIMQSKEMNAFSDRVQQYMFEKNSRGETPLQAARNAENTSAIILFENITRGQKLSNTPYFFH